MTVTTEVVWLRATPTATAPADATLPKLDPHFQARTLSPLEHDSESSRLETSPRAEDRSRLRQEQHAEDRYSNLIYFFPSRRVKA